MFVDADALRLDSLQEAASLFASVVPEYVSSRNTRLFPFSVDPTAIILPIMSKDEH